MRSTSGMMRLISRSLLVPKTLAISLLINAIFPAELEDSPVFSGLQCAC